MEKPLRMDRTCLETPLGRLTIHARGDTLLAVGFPGEEERTAVWLRRAWGACVVREVDLDTDPIRRLRAYFAGDVTALDGAAVETPGTAFQLRVWSALRRIAPGGTMSYSGLAEAIGKPRAVRAVGAANGANPIPIVIPCHRVIAAGGGLHGYGGGLGRKRWLLEHEARAVGHAASGARAPRSLFSGSA